jgi:hypothetical protein
MKTISPFRQSRIYAEGWNAARKQSAEGAAVTVVRLNPYSTEPEQSRWAEGFVQALV